MKKQPVITDMTRNTFIDAFCKLYVEKPIEKITIQELTELSGYNRTTFYHYFDDIYALLAYVEDATILRIKEKVSENIVNIHDEKTFIKVFLSLYEGSERFVKILLCGSNSAKFAERLKTEVLNASIGIFQFQKDDARTVYILDFYFSGVISVIGRRIKNDKDLSSAELGELLREILEKLILPLLKNSKIK